MPEGLRTRQSKHRDMVLHSYSTVKQNRMQICRSPKAEGAMLRAKGFNSRLLQPLKPSPKELSMSATLLYRFGMLFVLFALGHTYGFLSCGHLRRKRARCLTR